MSDPTDQALAADDHPPIDPELAEAEAEVAAEEAAAAGAAPAPSTDAAGSPPPPPIAEPAPVMIPKARMDQLLARLDQEREGRLRAEGAAEALRQRPTASAAQPPPAAPDPGVTRIAQIEGELAALYNRFDTGEIALRDVRQAELALIDERADLRAAARAQPQQQGASDAYVADQTRQLEAANPWLATTPRELMLDFMSMAGRVCAAQGINLAAGGPAADLAVRRALVQVLQQHGYGAPSVQQPAPSAAAEPPPAPGDRIPTAGLTPQQIQAKMRLANQATPSPTAAGSAPTGIGYTAADIESMSEDQILNLPADVQERIAASQ